MGLVSGLSLVSPLAWPIVGLDSNVKDSGRLAGHTMGWCLPSSAPPVVRQPGTWSSRGVAQTGSFGQWSPKRIR